MTPGTAKWLLRFQAEREGGSGELPFPMGLWGISQLPVRPLWGTDWCYTHFLVLRLTT